MENIADYWVQARQKFPELLNFGMNIAAAIVILIIGVMMARWIRKRLLNSNFTSF